MKMTDRRQVINWLKEDLEYYKNNLGKVRNYGSTRRGFADSTTTITQKLIDNVTARICELERLESERESSEVNRERVQKV